MKKIIQFSVWCLILSLFLMSAVSHAAVLKKKIRVGKYWDQVYNTCNAAAPDRDWGQYYHNSHGTAIPSGGWNPASVWGFMICNTGFHLLSKNWTETREGTAYETGTTYDYWVAGSGHDGPNDAVNFIPVDEADGLSIHKYWRYDPPAVEVDGIRAMDVNNLLRPDEGDVVDASYIDQTSTTADVMIESSVNTMMGITIHQRVYAWTQQNHDDYHIYDLTFTNTGRLDASDSTYTTQTIEDFYFSRTPHYTRYWASWQYWPAFIGEFPDDSLRASYAYAGRDRDWTDDLLAEIVTTGERAGWMETPYVIGDATLFVSSGPNMVNIADDDPSQPRVTFTHCQDNLWERYSAEKLSAVERQSIYEATSEGGNQPLYQGVVSPDYADAILAYPGFGCHHGISLDEWCLNGYDVRYVRDTGVTNSRAVSQSSYGPFTLEYGDSIRFVFARGAGSISPEKNWEVGNAWLAGNADDLWTGPYKLPPPHTVYPELAGDDNDKAKDSWVMTSIDSFMVNMYNAQWNFDQGYEIPSAPPPPSLSVKSLPDGVRLTWGIESDAAADLDGFRIYRSKGYREPRPASGQLVGSIELIGIVDKNTHSYTDVTAETGQPYYYAVTAIDDGTNVPDVSDEDGDLLYPADQVLESGIYTNLTTVAAQLTMEPGEELGDIRVVPNPFNINAENQQYVGVDKDKIAFLGLPPVCTIRIFTESGDLIQTIEHTNESGLEAWGGKVPERHSATLSGQRIVSGIYIAHFQTPDGESIIRKFVVVR